MCKNKTFWGAVSAKTLKRKGCSQKRTPTETKGEVSLKGRNGDDWMREENLAASLSRLV